MPDGTSWTLLPNPTGPSSSFDLAGLVALAADDVWAVGTSYESGAGPFLAHWDGVVWSQVAAPSVAP